MFVIRNKLGHVINMLSRSYNDFDIDPDMIIQVC